MKSFFLGILIGICAILPGVSGGVLLVIFNLYEKITYSIVNFFKSTRKNFSFLAPIFLGTIIGVFIFSNVLQYIFNKYYIYTSYVFIGLILGSLPLVFKQSSIGKISLIHVLCFLMTFSFSIYLIAIEKTSTYNNITNISFQYLVLCGTLMSAGVIIPGVSKSVILIMLEVYPTYLLAISTLNFKILIPISVGLVLGSLIFLNLINFLFKYLKSYTYASIIGFIIGSSLVLYPRFFGRL